MSFQENSNLDAATCSESAEPQPAHLAKRAALAAVISLVTVTMWTGAPLLALWVGSLAADDQDLSMRGLWVGVAVFGGLALGLAEVLSRLDAIYSKLAGRPPGNIGPSWMRSMRAPDLNQIARRSRITALEGIVIFNVYAAVMALVLWYVLVASRSFTKVL